MKNNLFLLPQGFVPSAVQAQKRAIAIETVSTELYFTVTDAGKIFRQHFDGRLATPREELLDFDTRNIPTPTANSSDG